MSMPGDWPGQRKWNADRRARNAAAGLCPNENLQGTHGPRTHGVRCEDCRLVHKRGPVAPLLAPEVTP